MKKIRPLSLIAIIFISLVTVGLLFSKEQEPSYQYLLINNQNEVIKIKAEIAKTDEEKTRGLMYRNELNEGFGMWFVYEEPIIPRFWMMNMKIPIDIIFIDENLVIQKVISQAPPCKPEANCPIYTHNQKTKYVLEVPSGFSEKNLIKAGSQIILNQKNNPLHSNKQAT